MGHGHCTRYGGTTSTVLDISASIIQGSAIGPASYVVNAADLTTVTPVILLSDYCLKTCYSFNFISLFLPFIV